MHRTRYRRYGKRTLDLLITVPALMCLAPVMGLLSLLIRAKLGSPVLFRQDRPGRDGRVFQMIKFRTMTNARDASGSLLPDEQRLTSFGRFLRTSSLDELPELWNVLVGEMSLVGPRPLLTRYLPLYSLEQFRRHEVLPGITGWAQVNGRNAISWEQKFTLDVEYTERMSMWLDLTILWKTLSKVLRREDVSAADHATMPEFQGSPQQATAETRRAA